MEKRRKRPSYLVPIAFSLMEIMMMWLLLSLFNWAINPLEWNVYAYGVTIIWILFSSVKLSFVLKRQNVQYD
ncbi:MAG: hypothetical protein COA44_03445 [Arcobacter sp.]|nr:MAG: hypothetical protein COA44_03445 [Arcobacter sp.]